MGLEQPLTGRHNDLTPQGRHGWYFLALKLCLEQYKTPKEPFPLLSHSSCMRRTRVKANDEKRIVDTGKWNLNKLRLYPDKDFKMLRLFQDVTLAEVWQSTSQLHLIHAKLIKLKTDSLAGNHMLEWKLALTALRFWHAKTMLPAQTILGSHQFVASFAFIKNRQWFPKEPAMRKPVSGWKLLAKQLNAAYWNACLLPALLPVSLTTHLHLPRDLYKTRRTMKLFSKMTLTF